MILFRIRNTINTEIRKYLLKNKKVKAMLFRLLLSGFLSIQLFPQWSSDPNINLQLTNWGDAPLSAVEDGRGGAFISTSLNVPLNEPPWSGNLPYLLWIDKYGYHKTTPYRIGGYSSIYRDMKLMKDGTGNYFAIFIDQFYQFGPPSIYKDRIIIQKLDSLGNKMWGEGVYISTDTVRQHTFYEAVSDNNGGCFIYYEAKDSLFTDTGRKLVQYISSTGERLWGDTGITLYTGGFQWNFFANNILYDGSGGIITYFENTYLVSINSSGNINWTLPSNVNFNGSYKMVHLNQDGIAIVSFKYEYPFIRILFDKVLLSGVYEDSAVTIADSIEIGDAIQNIKVMDEKIYFTWYGRLNSTQFLNYIQKIDFGGNIFFNDKGILLFDSLGSIAKMFSIDSSVILVTDHYAQAINLDGENLWQPNILQYTTRYMRDYDVVSDGNGGFISFWLQDLDGIWGQQVNFKGQLGVVTNIDDISSGNLPVNFRLYQNYPNPFNPVTTIFYSIPTNGYVELKVFDVLGREIVVLEKEDRSEGLHSVLFDGKEFSSGVYFYTIIVKEQTSGSIIYKATKKMLLIK